jgi:glycosyltransferase involved in cell wall biosynthesis
MRVALFSPLPPSPTGVADYSRLLLRGLSERFPVEAYTNGPIDPPLDIPGYPWQEFAERQSIEPKALPLYQMGNSLHHDFVYPLAFRHSGVLVLHDLVLHHSRLAMYMNSSEVADYKADMGDTVKRDRALAKLSEYTTEVEASYPRRGSEVAEIAIRMGGGRLLYQYPLHELLVRASKMTLVHNRAAGDELSASCPKSTVRVVRMGIELPEVVSREEARRQLGLGRGTILASFGLITPEKRISTALRCLKRLLDEGVDARYILVGETVPHYDARKEAEGLGVMERVQFTGRLSAADFWLYASAADICLNLRYPSAGETSATLLRLLAAGRAVVVTDQVRELDFPDAVIARASLDGNEDGLFCDVMDLLRRPDRRQRLEVCAREYVEAEHTPEAMFEDYARCLAEAERLPSPSIDLPRHLSSESS